MVPPLRRFQLSDLLYNTNLKFFSLIFFFDFVYFDDILVSLVTTAFEQFGTRKSASGDVSWPGREKMGSDPF